MNTPVSLEIAKLLKEKGYDIEIDYGLNQILNLKKAPTIAEVVMWIFNKHSIWIYVNIVADFGYNETWAWNTISPDNKDINGFNSPTEAYAAAIEYTLNNLIWTKQMKFI